MAAIVARGMQDMLLEQRDLFYYVTLMNEKYAQPNMPDGAIDDLLQGCYLFHSYGPGSGSGSPDRRVTLMGSGAILTEVIKAAEDLAAQGIACDVFSVTSWSELAREGQGREQRALETVRPEPVEGPAGLRQAQPRPVAVQPDAVPFVTRQLAASHGPIIAASDYVRAVPESIRAFLPPGRRYLTLGTDGFGRSDTRAALRAFFGVDAASIARAAIHALSQPA
jgi:pyruvate dehydrogenase E1 component